MRKLKTFLASHWIITSIAAFILLGAYWLFFRGNGSTYQFIAVTRGSIIQTVTVTGNTTPMKSVTLGFQNTGTIARINYSLGAYVPAGAVIADLSTASLSAALEQAQANVSSGEAALNKSKQDLDNLYAGIPDASADAYAKATDAVRNQLNQFFSNAETSSAQLSYNVSDFQAQTVTQVARVAVTTALNAWQTELATSGQTTTSLEALSKDELAYLATVWQLLNSVSATLNSASGISATTLATYRTNVSAALTEVNTATKNLNTISQTIASQKSIIAQAQAQLAQAKAGVASASANLQNAQIIAPISGIITQQDAKIGQLASLGTPLVSIIGMSGFEVDAGVSETDVGKLLVGDTVSMTLDAFPNETFLGSVFYIAPAQTNTQGVISYLIKVSFDKPDSLLKSGLTANLTIRAKQHDDVLILPQYAILQNDSGTFVQTLVKGVASTSPVILGIQDQNGNVEVLSGVTLGEQVINIGLKTK